MRKVAFEQRPGGVVKEGAMHLSGKRTSQLEETNLKGKDLTGSKKAKKSCTAKLSFLHLTIPSSSNTEEIFFSSTAHMNCLITKIIQSWGTGF